MNAPIRIPTARERYIGIVRHHVPTSQGRELEMRCSLLLLRDQATSALRRCGDDAAGVLIEVQRLAGQYAFASMPLVEIEELRRHLVMLTAAASGLEMFAYRLAYPNGGANASV